MGWENALGALATPNKMIFNDNLDNFRGNQHPAAVVPYRVGTTAQVLEYKKRHSVCGVSLCVFRS